MLTEELTVTSTNADGYTGDTIVLDHGGSVDVLKNVDYVIGTQFSDIMLGGDDVDVFNPNLGEETFVDGGDGYDVVVYENTDILENLTINRFLSMVTIEISRYNPQYDGLRMCLIWVFWFVFTAHQIENITTVVLKI